MSPRIVQFGTSRFLQAHADLFVHEARASGRDIGPITIVQTTADVGRSTGCRRFVGPQDFLFEFAIAETARQLMKP